MGKYKGGVDGGKRRDTWRTQRGEGSSGGVSSEEPGGLARGRHGHADREGSAIASLGHLDAGFFSRL